MTIFKSVEISGPISNSSEDLRTINSTLDVNLSFEHRIKPNLISTLVNPATQLRIIQSGVGGSAKEQWVALIPPGSEFNSSGPSNAIIFYDGANNPFYAWCRIDVSSTDPGLPGTGIMVSMTSSDSATLACQRISSAIVANANFDLLGPAPTTNVLSIQNNANGNVTSANIENMPNNDTSSVTHNADDSSISLINTPGIGSYSQIQSISSSRYISNQGNTCIFSALFGTGTTGLRQRFGVGNNTSAFMIGYNGSDFSILHRTGSKSHIHKFTVTADATSSGDIIISLDGIDHFVPITTGDLSHVAYEISLFDFKSSLFRVEAIDDEVIFSSIDFVPRTKEYAFNANGVTGITMTNEQVTLGQDNTETIVNDIAWNKNLMPDLDPQKINIYRIVVSKFDLVTFSIVDGNTGKFVVIHELNFINNSVLPSLTLPNLQFIGQISSVSSMFSREMRVFEASIFSNGINNLEPITYSRAISATTVDATELPLISFKVDRIYRGLESNTSVLFRYMQFLNTSNKSGVLRMYLQPDTVESKFEYREKDESIILVDVTNTVSPTGGRLLTTLQLSLENQIVLTNELLKIILHTDQVLVITIQRNTATNINVQSSISWEENL